MELPAHIILRDAEIGYFDASQELLAAESEFAHIEALHDGGIQYEETTMLDGISMVEQARSHFSRAARRLLLLSA